LRQVARCIAAVLRRFDGAARVGGDEFVVMLPATDVHGAAKVGHRLIETFGEQVAQFRNKALPISASIGAAQWVPGWSSAQLLEAADQAMYAAKHCEREQLVCYPPTESSPGQAVNPNPADAGSR
jgi:diguanylate cyclase